jgi:1,4-dihydroxy-2-naphthoyl-CoA synthase
MGRMAGTAERTAMGKLIAEHMDYQEICYEQANWVARITLNRPQAYNAYSINTLVELASAFRQAAFDDEVAVIVYTGAGDRAFCTGGDVKE